MKRGDFQNARAFLTRHPEFEFRKISVQAYLDEHPDALEGISEPENTVATLKSMQRLFSIAPAFDKVTAVTTLMRQNIISATAIRRMGTHPIYSSESGCFGSRSCAGYVYKGSP